MLSQRISHAINGIEPTVDVLIDNYARIGEKCDYFCAFFVCVGELHALNVRYEVPPASQYFIGSQHYYKHEVYLSRFARCGSKFEKIDEALITEGADPRAVSDGEHAYGIIITFKKPGWAMLLYDFRRQRLVPIRVENPTAALGKNWQPYLVDGELFAVQEMTPFRILKIDPRSGVAAIVEEHDRGFNLFAFYEHYPMFRGGANAIAQGGEIAGFGRTTSWQYRHQPFLWSRRGSGHLKAEFSTFFHAFNRRGYNIIDPASVFLDGDDLLLGLCCTERDWVHEQSVTNLLLRFSPSASKGLLLSEFLDSKPVTETMRKPHLDRHMFFCLDLPSAVPSRPEHGGRVSIGTAGHLVHGPYISIESEGRFCAELSYLTRKCAAARAGKFDVTASRIQDSHPSDFRILGFVDLAPTDGETAKAAIEFDTTGLSGALLELRVYVDEEVELNAFHIRTWRIDGVPDHSPATSKDIAT